MEASGMIKSLIKGWEGCSLTAYRCPAGVLTIGYGHTGGDLSAATRITQAQADRLFEEDCASFGRELSRWMGIDGAQTTLQHRYDALFSFAYNVGVSALRRSTLWRKVCADPSDPSIPAEFRRWVHASGKVLPGLVARRDREARIYQYGDYGGGGDSESEVCHGG